MKHNLHNLLPVLLCAILGASLPAALPAAVPLRWTVETSRLQPAVFDVVRGETLALEASFTSYGKPVATTNQTAFLCWQTNGMDNAWWTTNAVALAGNKATALFTSAMDPGASVAHAFIGLASTNDSNILNSNIQTLSYRAAFTLRYRHGPGASPAHLDLPVKILDFARVSVTNQPYYTKLEVDDKFDAAGMTPQGVTNIASVVVTNNVAPWAMAGHDEPQGMSGATVTNIVTSITTNKRDKTDIIAYRSETAYTPFVVTPEVLDLGEDPSGWELGYRYFKGECIWYGNGIYSCSYYYSHEPDGIFAPYESNSVQGSGTELTVQFGFNERVTGFTATRTSYTSLVPYSSLATTNDLADAINHESPRFSNEVLSVSTGISTNDFAALRELADLPIGGGATTVAGVLAAIVAAVLGLKRKKRDLTNIQITEPKNVHWVWFTDSTSAALLTFIDAANTYGAKKITYHEDLGGWKFDGEIGGYVCAGTGGSSPTDTSVSIPLVRVMHEEEPPVYAGAYRLSATDTTPVVGWTFATTHALVTSLTSGGASAPVNGGATNVSPLFTSANTSLMGVVRYPINAAGTILDRNINVVSSGAFTIPAGFTDLLIRFTGTPVSLTFADSGITDYGDDLPSESGDYLITVTKIDTDEAYIRVVTLEERT